MKESWVSSSAPAVYNFIASRGTQLDNGLYSAPEDMAVEALKIAYDQGLTGPADATRGINEPWKRAFTYGHAREAQWLAKIYLDVDLLTTDHGPQFGFRRVLVGAPLWIRTPDPRTIRLYATSDDIEVAASRRTRANRHAPKSIASSQTGNRDEASHGTAVRAQPDQPQCTPVDSPEPTVAVPFRIYRLLLGGFTTNMAEWAAEQVERDAERRLFHLGDPFGTAFAWVWSYDKDEAMIMLADYLAALRGSEPLEADPPIHLDEVLRALRLALPSRFNDYDEVVMMARVKVRKYYGADPNALARFILLPGHDDGEQLFGTSEP